MMRMIFAVTAAMFLMSASAPVAVAGGYGASAPSGIPICNRQLGDWFNPVDGQCHPASDKQGSIPTVPHSTPDSAYLSFKADCVAHGGTIYTGVVWNTMEPAKRLGFIAPDQLKCHRAASWTRD